MKWEYVIAIIIGVVFIGVITNTFVNPVSNYLSADERSLSCTKNVWCNLANRNIVNGTWTAINSTSGGSAYVEGANISLDLTGGRINLSNPAATQVVNITYNYKAANYDSTNSATRTLAPFIGLFFVLFIAVLIWRVGKKE